MQTGISTIILEYLQKSIIHFSEYIHYKIMATIKVTVKLTAGFTVQGSAVPGLQAILVQFTSYPKSFSDGQSFTHTC